VAFFGSVYRCRQKEADIFSPSNYVMFLLLVSASMILEMFVLMRPALHSSQRSPRALLRHCKVTAPIRSLPNPHLHKTYHSILPKMVNKHNVLSMDRPMYGEEEEEEDDITTLYSPISFTFEEVTPAARLGRP